VGASALRITEDIDFMNTPCAALLRKISAGIHAASMF
jgi:hypothetical protein